MSVALSHLLIPEKCYGTLHTVDSHSVENLVLLALMTRSVTFHKFFYNALLINSPAFIKQSIKSMSIGDGHVSGERPFRSASGRESLTDKHSLTLVSRFAKRHRKKKSNGLSLPFNFLFILRAILQCAPFVLDGLRWISTALAIARGDQH